MPLLDGSYTWKVCRWWRNGAYQMRTGVWRTGTASSSGQSALNTLNLNYHHNVDGVFEWGARLLQTGQLGLTHPSHR